MSRAEDEKYMARAIGLAKKGEGWVHPNPMVGAVIVKDGRIIGEGYHQKYGQLHAERNALAALSEPADGASMYVTLEPCCHYGKTPPCTEAIIEHGIGRVIIGSRDPNPLVAGKGAQILRNAGIEVTEDFMREECDKINPVFFHYITTKTPYVIMKYAMTADGKIATKTGASKWITGEAARQEVQNIRHACMGIMVGIRTVLRDDPLLNCRIENGRHPVRIICDSRLRIPEDSRICTTAGEYETIIACREEAIEDEQIRAKAERLKEKGICILPMAAPRTGDRANAAGTEAQAETQVQTAPGAPSGIDLKALMQQLGARSIDSILLEGGGTLNDSALRAGIVNEVRAFVAPKIFGGDAKTPVDGIGVRIPDECFRLQLQEMKIFEQDLMLRYRVLNEEVRGQGLNEEVRGQSLNGGIQDQSQNERTHGQVPDERR